MKTLKLMIEIETDLELLALKFADLHIFNERLAAVDRKEQISILPETKSNF